MNDELAPYVWHRNGTRCGNPPGCGHWHSQERPTAPIPQQPRLFMPDDHENVSTTSSDPKPCAGFPDNCPNRIPVDPDPPNHGGGVRCGCDARTELEGMAFSLATGLGGIVEPTAFKATLDRYAAQVLRAFATYVDNLPPDGKALKGEYWYLEGRRETADMAREKAEAYVYEAETRMKPPRGGR